MRYNRSIQQGLEFDDTHVHEGKQYEYRVSAVNAAGSGPPSDVCENITAKQTRGRLIKIQFKYRTKQFIIT